MNTDKLDIDAHWQILPLLVRATLIQGPTS
jgi:hypothetical protein